MLYFVEQRNVERTGRNRLQDIVTISSRDYRQGLVIGFIEHLYTQLITSSNCCAIANSHIYSSLQ
jgi:hypothetical protein